ncbi:hypothetical protein MSAN_01508700 [Mycena sanguinolenta]|uniref:Uncharacterized protein n=1 Tax=Mycena sanguinolenta TaxID=230812 RepID=A0A8H6Y7V5_9AGAR|nr:hypothetical protein MSAN_01508700 [Mycena sanguinolenta]
MSHLLSWLKLVLTQPIMKHTEFGEVADYIFNVFRKPPMDDYDLPAWIRPSTGELCLDLAEDGPETKFEFPWWNVNIPRLANVSLDAPDSEDIIISSLSEDQYHELCFQPSIAWFQSFQVSNEHPVEPGIFRSNSQYGTCVKITEPLILPEVELCWSWGWNQDGVGELLSNAWRRYDSRRTSALELALYLSFRPYEIQKVWLAQANRVFAELEEVAHVEVYVCVDDVQFILRIADIRHIPEGYLFVCPPRDFRTSIEPQVHLCQWPTCPAYWSLDPSGAARLSTEDARDLGFPAIHIETRMFGYSWDRSVYEGLRRFHAGKGFNPDSGEVARQLGYPLYEVLRDRVPFSAREVERLSCEEQDPEHCRELGHFL